MNKTYRATITETQDMKYVSEKYQQAYIPFPQNELFVKNDTTNNNSSDEYRQKEEITPVWMQKGKYKMPYDKFYTNHDTAVYCYKSFLKIAKQYNFDLDEYIFLEPSAGDGAFYNLLPEDKRIGIDIKPEGKGIIKMDFFDYRPQPDKKYVTIGNPPFGVRAWLALAFINRASTFSDLVGFILPMYFNSDGKGSAKNRVKRLTLLHSEELPSDIFHNGAPVKINTVWQVWGKVKNNIVKQKTYKSDIEIYTVCSIPARRCGLDKLEQYSFFIPSTFYREVKICKKFEDVKYGSGYGLIVRNNKTQIENYLNNVDWNKYSTRATNHCRHIGKSHIVRALIDGKL